MKAVKRTIKKTLIFFGSMILILSFSACSIKDSRRELSHQLGIDLMNDGTTLLHETDTIGWFGDGYILSEFQCNDGDVLKEIMNSEHWKSLPLSENMHRFFYEDYHFFNDLAIPVIEEGYYFFYDRHDQTKDPYDDTDLYNRASFNFTFAIYNLKQDRLYVCKFNT